MSAKLNMHTWIKFLFIPALLILLISCDTTENNNSVVSLNFSSGSRLSKTNIDELELTEVKILLRDVKLEHDDDEDFESDSQSDVNDDEEYVKVGPFVVNLNLSGMTTDVAVGVIPSGVYEEVKFKIHQIQGSEVPPDPEFKEGENESKRYSVIVKGNYNGEPFVYKSRKPAHQHLELNPPLSVEENSELSLTITVDPYSWFFKNNILLNPNDSSNVNDIDNNIAQSFKKAFKDDNDDGEED